MSLPKLEHPTFTLNLPSTGQKIVFRPFLVREEKILLVAQQSADQADIVRAMQQVVQNCVITEGADVSKFTSFDLEYFFVKLRSKSVNNIIELAYRDGEDGKERKFEVDLDAIEIVRDPKHTNIIEVTKTIKLVMKYPTVQLMDKVPTAVNKVDLSFDIITACLDQLIIEHPGKDDEVILFSNETKNEVDAFLVQLRVPAYRRIQKFFDTMPRLYHLITYTNDKGREQRIELKKLDDFFTWG